MVSTDLDEYHANLVRLRHGDENPLGPGFTETDVPGVLDRRVAGRKQVGQAGSFVIVEPADALDGLTSFTVQAWIWPTTPARGRNQGIVVKPNDFELVIEANGSLVFRVATFQGRLEEVRLERLLEARVWSLLAAAYDAASGRATLVHHPLDPQATEPDAVAVAGHFAARTAPHGQGPLVIAAAGVDEPSGRRLPAHGHFNGKIEGPCLVRRALSPEEVLSLAYTDAREAVDGVVAIWDFGLEPTTDRVLDLSGNGLDGRLVNMPTRAVTGHNWTGEEVDFRLAAEQYAAIHFHEDDLEDAGWEADIVLTIPEDLPSGIYAVRLRGEGADEEHVPFIVPPPKGAPAADIAFLVPTLTYMAYANERLLLRRAELVGEEARGAPASLAGPADMYLRDHPELAASLYDVHVDGTGFCYSSRLRPIPSIRPRHRFYTGFPERFPADLWLVDWLDEKHIQYDTLTDEDLHHEGPELIHPYRVVLTGTHPEYWTAPMLDALETYLDAGGRLMYLGGNGFYWVTSIDPARPHIIEVRRGNSGTRPWDSAPGELHHSTTGEQGGLWRFRGRPPNRLVGVGFTSQSDSDPGAGYVRAADSHDPAVSFAFEGVRGDEVIGDFGLAHDGAAGYEIDRFDVERGTPQRTRLLASSKGRHTDSYLLVVEDLLITRQGLGGSENEKVRADMAYLGYPNGGAVFSVGSCSWCGSLSYNGYDNNVSRITENVLRRFLRE